MFHMQSLEMLILHHFCQEVENAARNSCLSHMGHKTMKCYRLLLKEQTIALCNNLTG